MGFKEFFKPTLSKVVFTLFFIVLEFIATIRSNVLCMGCPDYWYKPIETIFSMHTSLLIRQVDSIFDSPAINIGLIIIINLIIGYLISCIIIYLINKLKRK